MSNDPGELISRRHFNATVAAGAAYTALSPFGAIPQGAQSDLCEMTAVDLAARLARKDVSAREVMTAHLAPVGLQIVGRHRDEFSVLQLAHAFERATHHARRRPAVIA